MIGDSTPQAAKAEATSPAATAPSPGTPAEFASHRFESGDKISGRPAESAPFVAMVHATRMPMIITNPRLTDNPIVFANDAFCRLTGYTREEVLGHNCRFLQGPDTDRLSVSRIRAAIETAETIEIDIRNYRKNGEPFWNRLLLAPVRDESGELAYFFASQMNVTSEREKLGHLERENAALVAELAERLRAQEESEARLRFATQAGRMGIWELNLKSGELVSSRIFRENFGRDPALPFTYQELQSAIHPDDRPKMQAALRHSAETGDDYDIEYRVVLPDESIGWLQIRAQVLHGTDGTPLHLAGTSLDITERRRSEERNQALLDLDDKFRVLDDPAELAFAAAETLGRALNVSRAGYGTIDPRTETITIERDWNMPGIRTLAGVLHFRDYGSYIEDLKRGETVTIADAEKDPRTAATADALKAISAQAVINMPVTEQQGLVALLYLNHATARAWAPEEMTFIREVAQRTRMVVERRRAEQDLRVLADSLETQVTERTKELMETEAALRQSQKMEAVGQLTGGLAHDFNNLLTGITGSLELIKARAAQGRFSDLDRYLATAQSAARRAAALTHRLLAFSRRQTLEPKATDVNRLVAGMEELVQRTVGPAIAVEVVASSGLWSTFVDPGQLENSLLNLCINARDAMPDGGKLTIETGNRWLDERAARSRDLPPGQYVSLCVSDTGTGMTQDVIGLAFDPFFTTKPIGQGTGLGLSMIYGFVRQSGGQARIYSEVGQGTTVCLYLPRHFGEAEAVEIPADLRLGPRVERAATVLVVDDEPSVRMLVADVLQELGYTAVEAEDGPAGLKVLQSDRPIDLLVTDVGLPGGMNGRQVADAGRALRPHLKVLFITGYAENAVLSHGYLDPGMHILTKPFAMEALASRIRELIA
jgi:PAS domain S-box-containing protein